MSDEQALAEAPEEQLPAKFDYGTDANDGFENQDAGDVQIPFIQIVQGLSPQLQKDNAQKFIDGCSQGDLFDSVSNELLPSELTFVPAIRTKCINEWVPRTQGGGFVTSYPTNDPIWARAKDEAGTQFGKIPHPETKNDLVETTYLFGIVPELGNAPYVLSFSSTKLKVWRKWNTQMNNCRLENGQKPPLFAHCVKLSTVSETNRTNQTYYNLLIKPVEGTLIDSLLAPNDPRFTAAKTLREMVEQGAAKVAEERREDGASDEEDGEGVF